MQLSSFSTLDSAGPLRSPLDQNQLRAYLRSVPLDIMDSHVSGDSVTVQQFGHGQSNPTYLVTIDDSSGNKGADAHHQTSSSSSNSSASRGRSRRRLRMVLRKKPAGHLLASAHAVEREYAVISALHRASTAVAVQCAGSGNGGVPTAAAGGVPVPRPVALCEDVSVLGTPFYLMEFAEGTVYLVRLSFICPH